MIRPCTCGPSKSEWRAYQFRAQCCVKRLSNCTRRCMVKSQVSLEAQGGNGGSAKGTDFTIYPLEVKNCLPIKRQAHISSHLLLDLLKIAN